MAMLYITTNNQTKHNLAAQPFLVASEESDEIHGDTSQKLFLFFLPLHYLSLPTSYHLKTSLQTSFSNVSLNNFPKIKLSGSFSVSIYRL